MIGGGRFGSLVRRCLTIDLSIELAKSAAEPNHSSL